MQTSLLFPAVLAAVLLLSIGAAPVLAASPPTIEWQKLLGGSSSDYGYSVQQTSDGGYVLLGDSFSHKSGDATGTNHGLSDLWVVKLDDAGAVQWQKLLGGSGYDYGHSVQQTSDGGYILLGRSESSTSGDVTEANHGNGDIWVVKLDGAGAIKWDKLLGGSKWDEGYSIQQTSDGGYVLLGYSSSNASGDVTGTNHGLYDYWVVKLNGTGAIEWDKLLGGSGDDRGYSVKQTSDGGYVLLGRSSSSTSGDVTGTNHGQEDFWVVKLDNTGAIQWQKLFGGGGWEHGYSVQQTSDGGYILLGTSNPFSSNPSGDITGKSHGSYDYWVVKLNGAGAVQWDKLLGGSGLDSGFVEGLSVQQTADGGYVLLGYSESSASGDVTGTNHGDRDFWVVKLDSAGVIQWQQLLGGSGSDEGYSVRQTSDGGYVLLGRSSSSASGDVTGKSHGGWDYWVVKLAGGTPPVALPGGAGIPTDTNGDGKYDDVNGNGRKDFADVVLYFNQMTWIAGNEPVLAFDFNDNGRIDFADVVWLFNHL